VTAGQHDSVTVRTGTLTPAEFAALPLESQRMLDAATARLLHEYGQAWLERERVRLRGEIEFFYA
jgi:hypothetical protein